jgi:hypothetical protein
LYSVYRNRGGLPPHTNREANINAISKATVNEIFEVFTAVTVKNVVFWDIKPSSYLTGDT